jgi:hypothetical protein
MAWKTLKQRGKHLATGQPYGQRDGIKPAGPILTRVLYDVAAYSERRSGSPQLKYRLSVDDFKTIPEETHQKAMALDDFTRDVFLPGPWTSGDHMKCLIASRPQKMKYQVRMTEWREMQTQATGVHYLETRPQQPRLATGPSQPPSGNNSYRKVHYLKHIPRQLEDFLGQIGTWLMS